MKSDCLEDTVTNNCLDACLRLVADRHRRRLLQQLRHDSTGKTTIDDLVDQLLGTGAAPGTEQIRDREQLVVQLYHTHLPKLEDHGVVEYDLEGGTVRYQPNDRIEAVLDRLPEEAPKANP